MYFTNRSLYQGLHYNYIEVCYIKVPNVHVDNLIIITYSLYPNRKFKRNLVSTVSLKFLSAD